MHLKPFSFSVFIHLKFFVDWDLNNILSCLGCAWETCGSSELAAEHLSFCSSKLLFFLPGCRILIPVTVLWDAETDFMVCSPEVVSVTLSHMCTGWCDSVLHQGRLCPSSCQWHLELLFASSTSALSFGGQNCAKGIAEYTG